ncbi:MAG TPA: protein-glutamate O-methyltransferase CheR [Terriglobales bacterium]|nr:protein-glutamate O-methyltransferase CheR [Terriglobales bacterium]
MGLGSVDFDYLRNLVRTHTAIVIDDGKEYLAEARLSPLLRKEGFSSVPELLQSMRVKSFSPLHRRVLDAMTNNETWFFRDLVPFEALRRKVIPEVIQTRGLSRRLNIWSAASSSGQEAYSTLILLHDNFPELNHWQVSILATDYSQAMVDRVKVGRYSQLEVNRGLPITALAKHFVQHGLEWEIAPRFRNMVDCRLMNLAETWPEFPEPDIIFLRNVLIYFDVQTKADILARVHRRLRPDGYLFLGGAETTMGLSDAFERVPFEKTAYYRPKGVNHVS